MVNIVKPKRAAAPVHSFIPTLLEQKRDGVYVYAFCPMCDHVEKSKVEHPGQSRDAATSVAKIRVHIQERHGKVAS